LKFIVSALSAILLIGCAEKNSFADNPQFRLARLISNENSNVVSDVELYLTSKEAYKTKYKDNLEYHSYDAPFDNEFDYTFVIVESLKANQLAIQVDWREAPQYVLNSLNAVSNSHVSSCNSFKDLQSRFAESSFNISHVLSANESNSMMHQCFDDLGLSLINIDNGTDAYVLTMVSKNNLSQIVELAKQSQVNISFRGNGV